MAVRRPLVFLLPMLLLATTPAAAQFAQPGASPFGAPASPFGAPQEPPCMKDFSPLRDDAEKKANAIRAASSRHATAPEACKLFNALVTAEAKMLKFVLANASWCGIPPNIVDQIRNSHKNTDGMRVRICKAAAAPPRPVEPTLGDTLGTTTVPDRSNIRSGRGTFDTLTGTPLGAK